MDAIETWEVGDVKVSLYVDMDPMSPRDWDNLGTLYVPGEIEEGDDPAGRAWMGADYRFRFAQRYIELMQGGTAVPVRFSDYGSSGARIYETDAEDANGIYYALPARVEQLGAPKEDVRRQLVAELEELDSFLRGEVYGYVVETAEGEHLDSCWGFIGDMAYAKQEAQEAAEVMGQLEAEYRTWAERQGIPTL